MKFDWDEFDKLTDAEKVEYMRRQREAAREASKYEVIPPGSIAPEKARHQEGSQVVGRMNPDGTVHYYADDEKPADDERAEDADGENQPDT